MYYAVAIVKCRECGAIHNAAQECADDDIPAVLDTECTKCGAMAADQLHPALYVADHAVVKQIAGLHPSECSACRWRWVAIDFKEPGPFDTQCPRCGCRRTAPVDVAEIALL